MDKEILDKIYKSKEYLEYLRYHPKWYYYLDSDPNNFFGQQGHQTSQSQRKSVLNIHWKD